MKAFVLLLTLVMQSGSPSQLEWKQIPEMSGHFPFSVAKIARDGDVVKLIMRVDFPDGAPSMFQENAPKNVPASNIMRVEGGLKLNCKTLTIKPDKGRAMIYLFDGRVFKSKEPSFKNHRFKFICYVLLRTRRDSQNRAKVKRSTPARKINNRYSATCYQ
jgi:hypothetical protein